MELRHLRYVASVVEAKRYRNASRHLHIAQPAVSQAVADLEDELDLELFVRKGSGVHLTTAVESSKHKECRQSTGAGRLRDGSYEASRQGSDRGAEVGVRSIRHAHFLPQLLCEYMKQNPNTEVVVRELTPAKLDEALPGNELDVEFTRESRSHHPQYTSRWLFEVPLVAVLPASRTVNEGTINIKELATDRFILLERLKSSRLFDSIAQLCRAAGFAPRVDSRAHLRSRCSCPSKPGKASQSSRPEHELS